MFLLFSMILHFTSEGFDISGDTYLLKCFLNSILPNVTENNPIDIKWIQTQQNIETVLATNSAKC